MTETVYFGLGSNLGDREKNVYSAMDLLKLVPGLSLVKTASFYESPPLYNTNQPSFLNSVVEGLYNGKPQNLLQEIQSIEIKLGRSEIRQKNHPRTIDIDILIFGNHVLNTTKLQIPHSKLSERKFVLIPMAEIAPDFLIPKLNQNPVELIAICPDKSIIEKHTILKSA